MSAPRKIWTPEDVGECGPYYPSAVEAEGDYGGTAQVYYHNDVVRELVAALEELDNDLKEHGYDEMGKMRHRISEALAKIAQEG